MARVAVIGAGLLGLPLAYELGKAGIEVVVFERDSKVGGVAGNMLLNGTTVDRFYHCILSSDKELLDLIAEMGLDDQVRLKETKMGFYHDSRLYPMTSPRELLGFPPLRLIDRLRLAYTIAHCRLFIKNWQHLETLSVEKWLIGLGGRRAYDLIWKPMLNAKFDGGFATIPATYIWSRVVRVSSTRSRSTGKEMSGHLVGGYQTLVDRLKIAIERQGGEVRLNAAVSEVVIENGAAAGVRMADGTFETFDMVVGTTPAHIFSRLIPGVDALDPTYRTNLTHIPYLGIVCVLVMLDRSLTPYYTLNITDTRVPFTGVIETTNLIDPALVGGNHLVYLPKYIQVGNALATTDDATILEQFLAELQKMFPHFDRSWVRGAKVMRERYVEPLHSIENTWSVPTLTTPAANLYLANTCQIYPELTNGQSVTTYGRKIAQKLAADLAIVRQTRQRIAQSV